MTVYYVDGVGGSDGAAGSSGSPWATIAHGLSSIADGDILGVRATGTYVISAALVPTKGTTNAICRLVGCTTTVGDGGRATIRTSGATAGISVDVPAYEFSIENLVLDGNSVGTTGIACISSATQRTVIRNCVIKNWTNSGVTITGATEIWSSEVTGCSGSNGAVYVSGGLVHLKACNVHDNTTSGIVGVSSDTRLTIDRTLVCNNSGGSSDGIISTYPCFPAVSYCTVHNNGRHGINLTPYTIFAGFHDNIITANGGYGIVSPGSAVEDPAIDFNALYGNTSGPYSGLAAGANDLSLSGLPYTNAGGGDFSLNTTAGQGAACRGSSSAGIFPGGTTTGYADRGAVQSQASGGSSGMLYIPNGEGT